MKLVLLFIASVLISFFDKPAHVQSVFSNNEKEIVCFVYHRFGDKRYPTTNVSLKDFEAHLKYLKSNNFQILTLSRAIDYLRSEEPVRKTAVLTIDDAYKSFYQNGLPLLRKYKIPATLFMNTKTVGAPDYMNWKELEEAISDDVEIGNHTHSHNYFLNEDAATRYATFRNEIELSQSIILKNVKLTPTVFSYPYGEFDDEMKSIVKKAGFISAAAQHAGVLYTGTELFDIPRFPMSEAYAELNKFAEKASMNALKVINQSSTNPTVLLDDLKPALTVTFQNDMLILNQIQCFIQGTDCALKIIKSDDKEVRVVLEPSHALANRRRTIFTITVPDKSGNWHWYSHLYINTRVK